NSSARGSSERPIRGGLGRMRSLTSLVERTSLPQRSSNYYQPRPPTSMYGLDPTLPRGWFQTSDNGEAYYYTLDGQTTWTRPTQPAAWPPSQLEEGGVNLM